MERRILGMEATNEKMGRSKVSEETDRDEVEGGEIKRQIMASGVTLGFNSLDEACWTPNRLRPERGLSRKGDGRSPPASIHPWRSKWMLPSRPCCFQRGKRKMIFSHFSPHASQHVNVVYKVKRFKRDCHAHELCSMQHANSY